MKEPVATVLTLFVALVGGIAFHALGMPAAFLTGSAVGVAIAVALHVHVYLPNILRSGCFAILGIMMGSAVTPETLAALEALPFALLGLVVATVGAGVASYAVLRRMGGWSRLDAFCGSIPGALSIVLALSISYGARMERVIMSQSIRLFILVALIPIVFGGEEAAQLRSAGPEDAGIPTVAVTVLIAFAAAAVAVPLKIPAAPMIGPLVVAVVLSSTGLVTFAVPDWLAAGAFVVLGASVAARFDNLSPRHLLAIAWVSFVAFLAAFTVAIATAVVAASVLDQPLGAIFLAYAPGGIDAMIALAFLLHYDVAVVAVLHIARVLALGLASPVLLGRIVARKGLESMQEGKATQ